LEDLERANLHLLNLEKPPFGQSIFLEKIGEYDLYVGIPEIAVDTIIIYSQDESDEALKTNTGDKKRFANREKFANWYLDD
jgi:hypothetical protein